jgi:hypothetical protein
MNYRKLMAVLIAIFMLFTTAPGFAADVNELERRLNIVSEELDRLKGSGGGGGHSKTHVHGYGEMHLKTEDNGVSTIDHHRAVIGLHSELSDWIHFNLEIDFEHAAQTLEFEFGYLDFLISEKLNFRTGVMLMPMGDLNEFHEPNKFWRVERPYFHQYLLPTTWQQAGAGVFGNLGDGWQYRAYIVNAVSSLDPEDSRKFEDVKFIRSGRAQVDALDANDWALTGRVEKKATNYQFGVSGYTGDSTNGHISEGGTLTILEGDVQVRRGALETKFAIMRGWVDDTSAINTWCANNDSCNADVPKAAFGWLLEAGLHLPQFLGWNTTHDFIPYISYEKIRPNDETGDDAATGQLSSTSNFHDLTIGVSYKPIDTVALKIDYQQFFYDESVDDLDDPAWTTTNSIVNLGVAYQY